MTKPVPSMSGQPSPLITTAVRPDQQALQFDPFDVVDFNQAVAGFDRFRTTVENAVDQAGLATGGDLARDIYWSFYQPVPVENDKVATGHRVNQGIVNELLTTGDWRQLHANTEQDAIASAIATMGVLPNALATLDQRFTSAVNQLHHAEQQLETLLAEAETWRELAEVQPAKATTANEKAEQAEAQAQAIQQTLPTLEQAVEQHYDNSMDTIRQAMRQAVQVADGAVQNYQNATAALNGGNTTSFGYEAGAGGAGGQFKDKVELARRLGQHGTLSRVMQVAGRFQRIALETQKRRVDHARTQVVGLEYGNDLGRIVPSELAFADDPLLEMVFDQRFLESRLLLYKVTGEEKVGRGPVIVLLDDSGSMSGNRELWAKGAMLGLLAVAKHQKRDFAVVHFDGGHQTFHFAQGQADQATMIQCIELFLGGGTNLDNAMQQALNLVTSSAYAKADVILLSDGISFISESTLQQWTHQRKERGMRCYSILIDTREGERVVKAMSDEVLFLTGNLMASDQPVLETVFRL